MEATVTGPVVLGSAALPWPVPGCSCPACLAEPSRRRARSGLLVAGIQLDGEPASSGPVRIATAGPQVLRAGAGSQVGAARIAALPAGRAACDSHRPGEPDAERSVLVVAHGGRTVLWAPDTGPLPAVTLDALAGAGLSVCALDVRDGDGRPDPRKAAHDVARLRAAGALAPGARLVAVGLTHDTAPAALTARLARCGIAVVVDGSIVDPHRPGGPPPRRTLVLGGSGSGKSAVAEDLLAAEPEVLYAATGPVPGPQDGEWAARVLAHRRRRPPWWRTVETTQLAGLLAEAGPPLLVDSLGTWAAAALERCGAWDDADGRADDWEPRWQAEVAGVVAAWRQVSRPVVAVAEEVGGGVVPETGSGRRFQAALGELTQRLAAGSERVLLVVAGRVLALDPEQGHGWAAGR